MQSFSKILRNSGNLTRKQAFYLILLLAAVAGVTAFVSTQSFSNYVNELSSNSFEIRRNGASLILLTENKEVAVGETFNVEINLKTNGEEIDGVDLYSLQYDPELLEVIDSDQGQAGTQIKSEGLLPIIVVNRVDKTEGLIQFAQVTNGGEYFKGSGQLATVTLKALKAGETYLSFDFTPRSTTDTNVASLGVDRLQNVGNLNLTIR